MLIIKLKGGLGNQLFQYAFGRLIALRREEELWLDKDILNNRGDTYRAYGLGVFNIKAGIALAEEVKKIKYPYGAFSKAWRLFSTKILRQFHIGYEKGMLKTKKKYLDGFFQSYKYLEPIKTELLSELSLKDDAWCLRNQAIISEMENSESVAVHIRRGDYVSDAKTKAAHFICDLPYYEKAIALMREKFSNAKFFIFSDDITWAKDNLKAEGFIFVSKPEMKDYEELMLMTLCKHSIIANSTFSFWSAWLNQNPRKTVIAPALWNKRYNKHYKDLLPENWIRI